MKISSGPIVVAGALAALAFGSIPSLAQGEGQNFYAGPMNFVGRAQGMGPKCPPMQYHVVTRNRNQLEGAAFTFGENGMELYSVAGTLAPDGKVAMDLKPAGVGTPQKIEGTYRMGMLMVKMGSGSCHVDEFMMMPVVPPMRVGPMGGSG